MSKMRWWKEKRKTHQSVEGGVHLEQFQHQHPNEQSQLVSRKSSVPVWLQNSVRHSLLPKRSTHALQDCACARGFRLQPTYVCQSSRGSQSRSSRTVFKLLTKSIDQHSDWLLMDLVGSLVI
ncbi:hypothetical protein B0H19DRAFT_1070913 [Mycena capillaripes]|nr:hypothetical protein B0H19DRAFT_1070913 [Mycena capillaripes]